MLTDAGPLVALLDRNDQYHQQTITALPLLAGEPLLTTWPCFTEAMYLLGRLGGFSYQAELWKMFHRMTLTIHPATPEEVARMSQLMEQYQDTPMDLADASLVAAAEYRGLNRVFTLDSDFRFYRLNDGTTLNIIP